MAGPLRRPPFDTFIAIPDLALTPVPLHTKRVLDAHVCECNQPTCTGDQVQIKCSCGNANLQIAYFKSLGVAAMICWSCRATCGALPIDPLSGMPRH